MTILNKIIIVALLLVSVPVFGATLDRVDKVKINATLSDIEKEKVEQYTVIKEYNRGENKVTHLKEAVRDGEIPSMAFEDVLPTFNAVWVEYGLAHDMEALKRIINGNKLNVGSFFKEIRKKQLERGEKVIKLK